jgi:hypothetical protein
MLDEDNNEVQLNLTDEAREQIERASGKSAERVGVRVDEEAPLEEKMDDDPRRAIRA